MARNPKLVWKSSAPEPLEMRSPSSPHLRRSPAFPLEVCELVIDACKSLSSAEWDVTDTYSALLACSLTCKAWQVRARRWLFYHVKIVSSIQFSKFLHVLADHSFYGDFVRRLSIAINPEAPGPFLSAGIAIIMLTNKLRNLGRMDVMYTAVRPHDVFFACIRRYNVLNILSISGYAFKNIKHLVRCITSFPALDTLKIVQDDYDPPTPSRFPLPLLHADIPKLTTIQIEISQTEDGPCPSSPSTIFHLIDWLNCSPVCRHLQKLWIVLTVATDTDDYGTVRRINKLLTSCGESLRELAITIQVSSDVGEPWRLDCLKGLTLRNNLELRHLNIFRLPWQTATTVFATVLSESSFIPTHLETITLSFHTNELWPDDVVTRSYNYSIFQNVDLALSMEGKFSSLRKLVIDVSDTAADVKQRHALRENLPRLVARELVHLTEVDEDQLYVFDLSAIVSLLNRTFQPFTLELTMRSRSASCYQRI
ncbi:hypothetical protein EIP91_005849 [Steccherinum ochraceum]|uniref:F-box domain-containing protein n=1 Tax=Steccherinum ochraceum TaxID=92696 RepID=A0A4R0R6L7_9APHY|nr:hypothetical protein EIP91_005849 [Steccherinum ochraceum]